MLGLAGRLLIILGLRAHPLEVLALVRRDVIEWHA
jgi:hypothetical protein